MTSLLLAYAVIMIILLTVLPLAAFLDQAARERKWRQRQLHSIIARRAPPK
jgi:hypothetical protein